MAAAVLPFNIPGFNPQVTPPKIKFPAGATDCHAHVFGPQSAFPYVPGAAYIPPDATPQDYARMLTAIGCQRAVLVQPSVYGSDNSCMVAALKSGAFNFRGVAVVEPNVTDKELQTLHDAGVRGIRINLASETEGLKLADGERLAPRLKAMGWHLQFFLDMAKMPEAEAKLAALPINIVIDHFAKCRAKDGVDAPAFQALLRLVKRDNVWAKLMGAYFLSKNKPHYPEVAPLARAMAAAAPDRMVFGTDWPHPGARDQMPDDGDLANQFGAWVPDEALRKKILITNPAQLYGF
ncbi:MAG TPA: amidohydrolase family protein [Burkholderiales bacterium]|nr:amidohydrolase family protein [Burkholderiales bacterium]